jgi:hypothetical protein
MSSPLTLENCLILACARTDPDAQRIQELLERGPDWQEILRKAERWGLAQLVYTNLRQAAQSGCVPKPVTECLRHFFHRDTIHGAARRELLRATLLRFAEASVPVIVLKGAALANLVYPSPALRPMGNIDLLVHRRDLDRVEAVLRSVRDALGPPSLSGAGAGPEAHRGIPYLDPESFSLLDVRHQIFSPRSAADRMPAGVDLPIKDFWERARPVQIASVATLVFSHEDLLLHLALHLAYAGGLLGHVRTLCDIGEVCRQYREALDWSQLVAQARAYEMGRPLYYALRLARELVGAGVPSRALTELRASFGQLPLEDRFMAAGAPRAILCDDRDPHPLSKLCGLGMRLLATCRARDSVMIACRHLARACQARLRRLANRAELRRARFGVMRGRLPATAIVLPIYRPCLEAEALMAVDRAVAVLRHGDWYLIAPQSLDTSFYEQRYGKPIVRFPDADLASVRNYSRLLLCDKFYAAFAQYEYMLITHDDVYVLRDDLPHWLLRRLDYIGAPWWPDGFDFVLSMSPRPGIHGLRFKAYVANGGFSLRRIAACRQLLTEFPKEADWFGQNGWGLGEDLFFALFGQLSQQFVLPNLRVAAAFAWEVSLPHMYDLCQGQLPMAIHAYGKYDPEFFAHTIVPRASSSVDPPSFFLKKEPSEGLT